jgi:hypothetical protein
LRESGSASNRPEKDFQVGVAEPEHVPVEQRSQRSHSSLSGILRQRRAQFLGVDEITLVRLVHRTLQGEGAETSRLVDEGSHGARDRNAVLFAAVVGAKNASHRGMQAPARDSALDRATAEPEPQELPPRHHPVLSLCQRPGPPGDRLPS